MIQNTPPHNESAGIMLAGFAYAMWGVMPLYWRLLGDVPPIQLTVHRIFWCALFLAVVAAWRGRTSRIVSVLREPKTIATLALTSVLITCNWTIFIYCVSTSQLVEASFGYYLTPLLSIALGVFLVGERLSRTRLVGIALAASAVGVQAFELGHIPWIGPALALSFGFYGYFRKLTDVDSLDGLLVETLILFPFTFGLVAFWWWRHTGAFPSANLGKDALLIFAGPLTAVPLAMFAAGARRIRLTTLGFLQYCSPSVTLLLATFGFHETFSRGSAIAFVLIWTAILIVALEGRFKRFRPQAT
jgi:chloramphenicol-sensitive protein RarD